MQAAEQALRRFRQHQVGRLQQDFAAGVGDQRAQRIAGRIHLRRGGIVAVLGRAIGDEGHAGDRLRGGHQPLAHLHGVIGKGG